MPGTSSVTKSPCRGRIPKCPPGASVTIRATGISRQRRAGVTISSRIGALPLRHLVHRADHVEIALVALREFARKDALATVQRLFERHEAALVAGHRLGR